MCQYRETLVSHHVRTQFEDNNYLSVVAEGSREEVVRDLKYEKAGSSHQQSVCRVEV